MTVNSRYINGALAYYDGHRKRIIDAIGGDVVKYVNDFVALHGTDATLDEWTITLVEAGASESTVTAGVGGNGGLLITTDANEDDGVNMQLKGEAFKFEVDKPLYFGAKLKMSEATQSDIFIGLAITDTTILGGVTDSIGFLKADGSTALSFDVNKDSTATNTAAVHTVVADTAFIAEFYWDGSTLEAFINGVSVATPVTTNLPNDEELTPSIHFLAGATVAKTCEIDWIRVIKFGRQ
jgi:hypothetical protein